MFICIIDKSLLLLLLQRGEKQILKVHWDLTLLLP